AEAKRKAAAKAKAEAEAKKRAEEAKRKAEAEAKAKAEAEKKRYEDAKNKYGGLFGGGSGDGKGNTGKPGNQGDPGGDPNASNLEGISTGTGKVGGGLGSRGVLGSPKVTDNSQKTGRVVVRVCVNGDGEVISAKFTQAGSTTTDARLRSIAEKNATRWKFSKGSMDKQCGTITYDFKVR
ncbi:MAG: energy transducer TonB, partial [Bacteroidota bacterium]